MFLYPNLGNVNLETPCMSFVLPSPNVNKPTPPRQLRPPYKHNLIQSTEKFITRFYKGDLAACMGVTGRSVSCPGELVCMQLISVVSGPLCFSWAAANLTMSVFSCEYGHTLFTGLQPGLPELGKVLRPGKKSWDSPNFPGGKSHKLEHLVTTMMKMGVDN